MRTMPDMKWLARVMPVYALLFIAGCGGADSSNAEADGKLKYEPKVNKVSVVPVERKTFHRELVSNGKARASRKASLDFRSPGVISEVFVENGQWVKAGSVLARQDAREQELSLESAKSSLDKAQLDYLDVLAGQGYSDSDSSSVPENVKAMARMRSGYDAALNGFHRAGLDLEGTELRAQFDGRVADIKIRRFDKSGSAPYCTLLDDRIMDVEFMVLESEYQFVRKGLAVDVIPYSGSGETVPGEITVVNPSVDKNGQVAVRARVANTGALIDGMNVRVIVKRQVDNMLVVPKSAVLIRDNMEVLFKYSGGKASWTYVNVLMSNSSECAVEANQDRGAELSAGDTVIVSGNLNLADGSQVSIGG